MHRLSTKQQPCTELSTLCKWNQRKPKHNTSPRPAARHRGEIGGASKRLHQLVAPKRLQCGQPKVINLLYGWELFMTYLTHKNGDDLGMV